MFCLKPAFLGIRTGSCSNARNKKINVNRMGIYGALLLLNVDPKKENLNKVQYNNFQDNANKVDEYNI